ncbi:MAG: nitrite reductase [Castellaniella sp.]|uniref:siroheme decarboxylase subunit beta n=1 Tax=Castellaniella sp. TaxID=1955812 RepID=UPI002A35A023|nr:nitrite reductase [Castellaniella sp.]MDY0310353.1 nitrite reductase [Castellaniella sp.]
MSACSSRFDAQRARRLVELCQAGLPLVDDPWAWIGTSLGCSAAEALELLAQLQDAGVIRRIAAVPNHYRLGYRHNGMTVWDVEDQALERLGPAVGRLPFVSHCYRRPRRAEWPYNLFAMIHARSAHELAPQRDQIRALLGPALRTEDMLVSSRILKKTGLRLPQSGEPQC